MGKLVVCLLLLFGLFQSSQTNRVPVFIWTSGESVKLPDTFAGHSVHRDVFLEDYLIPIITAGNDAQTLAEANRGIHHRNVAVFLQDELSTDEVSRNSDVFNTTSNGAIMKHLKDVMSKYNSQYLPSVSSAAEAIDSVISDAVTGVSNLNVLKTIIDAPYELPVLQNTADQNSAAANVFLVQLPDTESWTNIDEIIGSVTRQLESFGQPFAAIYTGASSSLEPIRDSFEEVNAKTDLENRKERGARRKLLQYFPSYFTFLNLTNCVYLYSQNISISIDHQSWLLPLNPTILDSSFCSNYSALLAFSYYDVDESLLEVKFEMYFGVTTGLNAGYWLMPNFTVSYSLLNATTSVTTNATVSLFPLFITETPYSLSYSCYTLPPIVPLRSSSVQNVNISFVGFQVQAFNISNNEFGYYNDCVGFFTIMTWACLFTLFILVGILWFAACMFLGLSTPDRYDDAHGKTITINAFD